MTLTTNIRKMEAVCTLIWLALAVSGTIGWITSDVPAIQWTIATVVITAGTGLIGMCALHRYPARFEWEDILGRDEELPIGDAHRPSAGEMYYLGSLGIYSTDGKTSAEVVPPKFHDVGRDC